MKWILLVNEITWAVVPFHMKTMNIYPENSRYKLNYLYYKPECHNIINGILKTFRSPHRIEYYFLALSHIQCIAPHKVLNFAEVLKELKSRSITIFYISSVDALQLLTSQNFSNQNLYKLGILALMLLQHFTREDFLDKNVKFFLRPRTIYCNQIRSLRKN